MKLHYPSLLWYEFTYGSTEPLLQQVMAMSMWPNPLFSQDPSPSVGLFQQRENTWSQSG